MVMAKRSAVIRRSSFILVASVLVLLVGIWKNVSLSMALVSTSEREDSTLNDAPTRLKDAITITQVISLKEAGHSVLDASSAKSSTSNTTFPFPRWNDSDGIQWEAIESYIRHADDHLTSGKDLLECPNGGCPKDMPNVLYIFGAHLHPHLVPTTAVHGNVSSSNTTSISSTAPSVWVERRRRKLVGQGFSKRYPILEELMHRSLQYILTNQEVARSRYPRLVQHIIVSDTNATDDFLGIPLIMNFGDNRQCHFQNLKQQQNVPVFTLAVPTDCQFAFPIPHPAALDTAKVYGNRWNSILDRRRRVYPIIWNQTRQAVWRGSPSGTTMRQTMVRTANQLPSINSSLMEQVHQMILWKQNVTVNVITKKHSTFFFNVGFGKPFHKIVPTYQGPLIPRQSRIWFEDFAEYRVTLDADGSSWSERFGPLLCLNTIVAKLEPSFVDWLWPTVQANRHFVSIHKDSSNLWSAILPLLKEEEEEGDDDDDAGQEGERIRSNAREWCVEHMTYERMMQDFLLSLEKYVSWLDRGDPEWSGKWGRLFLEDMPPKHHHWQALPVVTSAKKSEGYFPLWRNDEDGLEYELYY